MKKNETSKEKASGPEKFWNVMVKVYFKFYASHFRDQDGYSLSPNWNEKTRGMESKGLKEIITRLRMISEEKNIEWTEDVATRGLTKFLQKAYTNPFHKKSFMCCLMNKYKDMIIVSEVETPLSRKIIELWRQIFPDKLDVERDLTGSQIIIGYLKQQFAQNNIVFNHDSVMSSVSIIFKHIQQDEFWNTKSLNGVARNISEFVMKIKSKQNGTSKAPATREGVIAELSRRNLAQYQDRYNASLKNRNQS